MDFIMFKLRLEGKAKGYREEENSTFTSYGKTYSVNRLYEQIESNNLPIQAFLVKDLEWIIKYGTPDPERLKNADLKAPICVVQEERLCVVDGFHRLCKAKKENVKELRGYLIPKSILEKARI